MLASRPSESHIQYASAFCRPGAGVAEAAALMHERGVKRRPAVDSSGQLVRS